MYLRKHDSQRQMWLLIFLHLISALNYKILEGKD